MTLSFIYSTAPEFCSHPVHIIANMTSHNGGLYPLNPKRFIQQLTCTQSSSNNRPMDPSEEASYISFPIHYIILRKQRYQSTHMIGS